MRSTLTIFTLLSSSRSVQVWKTHRTISHISRKSLPFEISFRKIQRSRLAKTVTLPSSTIIVNGKTLLQPLAELRHSQIGDPGRTVRQSAPDRIRSPRIIRPRRCINSSSSRISRVSNVPLDRHGGIRRPAIRSRWHREICSSPCLVIEIHPTWLIEFPIFRT